MKTEPLISVLLKIYINKKWGAVSLVIKRKDFIDANTQTSIRKWIVRQITHKVKGIRVRKSRCAE